MPTHDTTTSWPERLLHTGAAQLQRMGPAAAEADPHGTVSPRSRLLCAGLSELARVTQEALGGGPSSDEAVRAAALLSLLTKIDDQVIDSVPFHGGRWSGREALRERTRHQLAPTLDSLRSGAPATDEPRCILAAELGRALQDESFDPARRAHLLEVIACGWTIQVEAVATFTAHPAEVSAEQIARVTADISGAWLLMIALCGTLPRAVQRGMTPAEEQAFFTLGGPIQRADALADWGKDAEEGLIATVPGQRCWNAAGERYLAAVDRGDEDELYGLLAGHAADLRCLPDPEVLEGATAALSELGELPTLLRWIHGFLLARYLDHPLCRRRRDDAAFRPFAGPVDEFATLYRAEAPQPAPDGAPAEAPCSER